MIKTHCFQKEWIDSFKRQKAYSKINPPLVEKMIHAFSLLQHLKKEGLPFVFKGGTSLLLLLKNARRFSVDIDILTEAGRNEVEQMLDRVIERSIFTGWKLDERRSYQPGIPKAHYELSYDSRINRNANYILLDILFERSAYPKLQERPIQSTWIETEETLTVTMPTTESITGDKLTAFAPTTTGILYGKGKELEIIKQLFDLGHLFDEVQDMHVVAASFGAFVKQEIAYRGLTIGAEAILMDSIGTARIISLRERNRMEPEKSYFAELQRGIRSFSNYLIDGYFQIDEAVTSAAKVAYLCAKLWRQDHTPLVRYTGQDVQALLINNPLWNVLNKLKRFPDPAAFFYWHQCLTLLGLESGQGLLTPAPY